MASPHEQIIERTFAEFCTDSGLNPRNGGSVVRYVSHLVMQKPPFSLESQALEDGIVDGASDGGVDAVYAVFNGELLDLDSEVVDSGLPPALRHGTPRLDVLVIQTKKQGAGSTAVEKLQANLPRLLDLAEQDFGREFNDAVIERFDIARRAWRNLAGTNCVLNCRVIVGTLSDVEPLSAETLSKVKRLEETLADILPGVNEVSVSIEGARALISRSRASEPVEYLIPFEKHFPSGEGVVALVRLGDYAQLVDDGVGNVAVKLLDENVRGWQGMVEVNTAIRRSLERAGETPFWWLNNGVTMVCESVTTIGESLRVVEPRIVNGLQTTRTVHDYLAEFPESSAADEYLLVRFIRVQKSVQRDAVIRATNSQTNVDPASLRATDAIQRNIEEYLQRHGIYYDRRKGSFRDYQKTPARMLSIRDLGQVLTSILMARPDLARGKPTSLLKDTDRYSRLFNERTSMDVYLLAANLWLRTGEVLLDAAAQMNSVERRYLKLHIISAVVSMALGAWTLDRGLLDRLASRKWEPTRDEILRAAQVVLTKMREFEAAQGTTLEKATKAQGFTSALASIDWSAVAAGMASEAQADAPAPRGA